jgi:hypothetical protein
MARDLSLTGDRSPYLAFLVAAAVALVVFFRRDWGADRGRVRHVGTGPEDHHRTSAWPGR